MKITNEEKIRLLKEKIRQLDLLEEEFKKCKKWQIWKLFQVISLLDRLDELKRHYAKFGL